VKAKNTLISILSSAAILFSANNTIAQIPPGNAEKVSVRNTPAHAISVEDDFRLDYTTQSHALWGIISFWKRTATWESQSCNVIPSEKENKKVMKVVNGTALIKNPLGDLDVQFRVYIDSLGKPIESMVADYNCQPNRLTSLDSTTMKEEFPERWKEIRGFHMNRFYYPEKIVTNGTGKGYKIDSSVADVQTTYFSICNVIRDADSRKTPLPFDTTLEVIEDSTIYPVKMRIEEGRENYAKVNLYIKKGKDGKPPPDTHGLDRITLLIDRTNYIPKSIKVTLYDGLASAEVKLKDYEVR
jgi:hypothetical protein